ncbi:MAG TPA: UDP-N-acetylmuramoyl-tripeptide--D-alanyl-D-alanine ligase [Firmicutes bacterium]|jgi:UDP-N-acetylmuramoyl-tripeptide--D-alanyl-D-alanine ligase|nr:UDP-N-acetylmuramoyl-tripeptide--D-alanyl-D-alanine ligase [Bacillota bacterium]
MNISIKQIIKVVGGKPSAGDFSQKVTSVVIDSRKVMPGSMFVAFAGEHTDGHNYLAECARKGAIAALVERDVPPCGEMVTIQVDNTFAALQRLATWQRLQLKDIQVLGVTGSSGKTTTKELVAGVLSQKYSVFKSRGNHNNAIGLPLMIFEMQEHHQWAVLEMGMSARGEIKELCAISRPGLGIITNIGEAHMEHLGSQQAIMEAKFELAQDLEPPCLMILNGDDPWQRRKVKEGLPGVKVIFYGLDPENNIRAVNIQTGVEGSSFDVQWSGKSIRVELGLLGAHNVSNALAAFAAGLVLDVEPRAIVMGLASVRGEGRRLQPFEINGLTLIDDSYNANPDSMGKALAVLGTYPPRRRKVAFLGDMLELGPSSPEKHRQVGRVAAGQQLGLLVAVGQYAEDVRQGAIQAGMGDRLIITWPDSKEALSSVDSLLPGDVVLVKGSLGAEMDRIVQVIKAGGTEKC